MRRKPLVLLRLGLTVAGCTLFNVRIPLKIHLTATLRTRGSKRSVLESLGQLPLRFEAKGLLSLYLDACDTAESVITGVVKNVPGANIPIVQKMTAPAKWTANKRTPLLPILLNEVHPC